MRWTVLLLGLLGVRPVAAADPVAAIEVAIVDLRNDDGLVHVALYDREEGFPAEGRTAFRYASLPIADGRVEHRFEDVPYGRYAIGFLHDEDGDEVMDKSLFGVPKEGYGASNDARGGLGPPHFDDALFTVDGPVVRQLMHPVYWL